MIVPSRPANDAARVDALHRLQILDTPEEERFSRITRIAARLFQVPIAVISLVDTNREWFKSCHGLPLREGARDTSFCGHAILQSDTLVIPDATLDPRFSDNPQVTGELQIRFYAGHPLRSQDGHNVGTLCLKDRKPRAFGVAETQCLQDLAAWTEHELQYLVLHSAHEQLERVQGELQIKLGEMELLNKAMMNREERILELKERVQHLERDNR